MTTLTTDIERPSMLFAAPRGGRTLEDTFSGAWEALRSDRAATCPICAGAMQPRYGSGRAAVGGRCIDCGSDLG